MTALLMRKQQTPPSAVTELCIALTYGVYIHPITDDSVVNEKTTDTTISSDRDIGYKDPRCCCTLRMMVFLLFPLGRIA